MFQKLSEGTPQQQAQMRAFRAYNKRGYTEKKPTCYSFAAEMELLEALIRAHWGRADDKAFMAFLLDSSWNYFSPYDYLKEWTLKAVEHIQQGMTFEELQASGLLEFRTSHPDVPGYPRSLNNPAGVIPPTMASPTKTTANPLGERLAVGNSISNLYVNTATKKASWLMRRSSTTKYRFA